MITRLYSNAKDELQSVTLSKDEWEVLTEEQLAEILGFSKPAPATPAAPKKATTKKGIKK